jgi:hypothetical protein
MIDSDKPVKLVERLKLENILNKLLKDKGFIDLTQFQTKITELRNRLDEIEVEINNIN